MKTNHPKFQITPELETTLKNWDKYKGSIVMVIGDKVFSTKRAKNVNKIIRKIEKEYHKRPLITYIPKEDTLILFS